MKTIEPLRGFRISSSHPEVHLALLFSQITVMSVFKELTCQTEYLQVFLITHAVCFVLQCSEKVIRARGYLLWSNFMVISVASLYLTSIYFSHFFELQTLFSQIDKCTDNKSKVNAQIWHIIELRVFYGFILSSVAFIMISQFFKVQLTRS